MVSKKWFDLSKSYISTRETIPKYVYNFQQLERSISIYSSGFIGCYSDQLQYIPKKLKNGIKRVHINNPILDEAQFKGYNLEAIEELEFIQKGTSLERFISICYSFNNLKRLSISYLLPFAEIKELFEIEGFLLQQLDHLCMNIDSTEALELSDYEQGKEPENLFK